MNRMPPCQGKTHAEIWELFRDLYSKELPVGELRRIHERWVQAAAAAK